MTKYHITAKGEPGICRAKHNCPLGGESEHYGSKEEARAAYEKAQENVLTEGFKKDSDSIVMTPFPKDTLLSADQTASSQKLTGGKALDKNNDYVLVDYQSGTVFSTNAVVVDYPENPDEQEEFNESPEMFLTNDSKNIRDVSDLSDFKRPVIVERDTGLVVPASNIRAINQTDLSEDRAEDMYSSDYEARRAANELGTRVFPKYVSPELGVNSNTSEVPEGTNTYENVVTVTVQGKADNDIGFKNYTVIVPNVKKLTDSKKMEIGRAGWINAGKDAKIWDESTKSQKLSWAGSHIGRRGKVTVENKHGDITLSHDSGMSSGEIDSIRIHFN